MYYTEKRFQSNRGRERKTQMETLGRRWRFLAQTAAFDIQTTTQVDDVKHCSEEKSWVESGGYLSKTLEFVELLDLI